jgi:hypothetical protein
MGTYQDSKTITKVIGVDQDCTVVADTASQNPAQAEQRTAAAHFATFPSAVADDFAVGAKDSFLQRNRRQNQITTAIVGHEDTLHQTILCSHDEGSI